MSSVQNDMPELPEARVKALRRALREVDQLVARR